MYRIIARLSVLTFCCLSFLPGAFAEEAAKKNPPEPNGNNCNYVNIYIRAGKSPQVKDSGVVCNHGNLAQIEQLSPTETRVILSQSYTYGPDCLITATSGQITAVVKVQQNYCGYEAGDLHTEVVSGPAEITKYQPGSYGDNRPGQVWVDLDRKPTP